MKGYWNKPEETAKVIRNGWLYTGDVARMDEDGYFYIVQRKKDLILVSGFNVYRTEVEDVLFTHSAVKEAAVIGVNDPYRGESVKAFRGSQRGRAGSVTRTRRGVDRVLPRQTGKIQSTFDHRVH